MQIVSGLRLFVPLEQMQGRRVVVLANLKPAKLCAPETNLGNVCASTPGVLWFMSASWASPSTALHNKIRCSNLRCEECA